MRRERGVLVFVAGVLVVGLLGARAAAEPVYLPLDQGATWSYATGTGGAERKTVDGMVEIFGETAQVIRYSESSSNEGLENYWTSSAAGDVYLWGFFRREDEGWGYLYQPPILWIDAPLHVGKSWETEFQVYSLPDTILVSSAQYVLTTIWEGVVAVPAGDFQSFLVEGSFGMPEAAQDVSPDGRLLSGRSTTWDWFSDGVGLVQYGRAASPNPYRLVDYGTTPADATSWTTIKSLFR